ncbi:mitochondrial 54S ribosomal protein uL5m [Ascoidea rubescens DSM 1968]|uniref:Ribosomal protein L5 n=1 Tax=Ascoidea rubescens DSM 1968 TaxID=1344418 RepID=A0A1D2VMA5_9ASCO|nr:ribosomal protein L5 [Ascoidea rubescens DSM 1968]ODV62748.1 ribosomal protein L5 [Ascoidea rubescens DSM 1968]
MTGVVSFQFAKQFARTFSSAEVLNKCKISIVKPVHHLVPISKAKLSKRFEGLKYEKTDIRSVGFRPVETEPDRFNDYYENTLKPNLLLMTFDDGFEVIEGKKRRSWDGSSSYHIHREKKKPKGVVVPTRDITPYTIDNLPKIESLVINCYANESSQFPNHPIVAQLLLQQITNVRPRKIYSRSDVVTWKIRRNTPMGAKVELKGKYLSQFLSTLTELVLPRVRSFNGLDNKKGGDRSGNISFGLTSEDVRYFPEIEANQDLWPVVFGMNFNIITSAQTDNDARLLLSGLGFPFKKIAESQPTA